MQWWKKQESPCFSCGECQSLKEKEGMLRLYYRKESIAEAAYCSYLGLRQKSYRFEAKAAGIRDFSAVFLDEYTYRGIP